MPQSKHLDVRTYAQSFERIGELKMIEGADWNLEIGTLAEVLSTRPDPPALLFDSVKGYGKGYRILTNIFNTQRRTAICFGLSDDLRGVPLVEAYRKKLRSLHRIPPQEVADGPIFENVDMNEDVDLLKFPTPLWHSGDGGRYIGTADAIIMKDPDDGWVNLGNYRVMIHDKKTAAIWIGPGHHGKIIQQKYWSRGQNCPVAVVCGIDPLLFSVTTAAVDWSVSEFDVAGGLSGSPYEVVKGRITGLPIPAHGEIAFEGEMPPPRVESKTEGPFGEWTGYASGTYSEAVVRVSAVYHRNDPIMTAYVHPGRTYYNGYNLQVVFSAHIWDELERAKVPGVKGVWVPEATSRYMVVISLKQMYAGHAKQAALAVLGSPSGGGYGRFVVVVDDDIDAANINDVLWAMATRCDPERQIDIVRGGWSNPLDPTLDPKSKELGNFANSKAVINACKPFHWIDEFPVNTRPDSKLIEEVSEKWKLGQ